MDTSGKACLCGGMCSTVDVFIVSEDAFTFVVVCVWVDVSLNLYLKVYSCGCMYTPVRGCSRDAMSYAMCVFFCMIANEYKVTFTNHFFTQEGNLCMCKLCS